MQHLTTEELARLVDEAPDDGERAHLEMCGECRAELEEMRQQTEELQRLPLRAAPRHHWPLLESRLRAEGLVAGGGRRGIRGIALMRAAAALALFVAGGYTGARFWSGAPGAPAALSATPATAAEAEAAVRQTEAAYLEALTRYTELSGGASAPDPVNRLAALEGIVLTTRAALQDAPADPVINGYHLAALSQREAILRQIASTQGEEWF